MKKIKLNAETRKNIEENLIKRSPSSFGEYQERVDAILAEVKAKGDEAVFSYTKKFDGADINASNIRVTDDEIKEAYNKVEDRFVEVIRKAIKNIREYHEQQLRN